MALRSTSWLTLDWTPDAISSEQHASKLSRYSTATNISMLSFGMHIAPKTRTGL